MHVHLQVLLHNASARALTWWRVPAIQRPAIAFARDARTGVLMIRTATAANITRTLGSARRTTQPRPDPQAEAGEG